MSPTVLQFDGVRVEIRTRDHNPPHVHVIAAGAEAVFDLTTLEITESNGFSKAALKRITKELELRKHKLLESWRHYHE